MSGKRSDIEISAAILRVAMNGAKKSHIVYKANLNFMVVKKYLKRLVESGLMREPDGEGRLFRTTEKGAEYIKYFQGFKQYMHPSNLAP